MVDLLKSFNKSFQIINNIEALKDFAEGFSSKLFAFDTETTSLKYSILQITGLSIFGEGVKPTFIQFNFTADYYIVEKRGRKNFPVKHKYKHTEGINIEEALPYLLKIFTGAKVICANGKFDSKVANKHGFYVFEVVEDTFIQSKLLDSNEPAGLKENTLKYLGIKMASYNETAGNEKVTINKKRLDNIVWPKVDFEGYGRYGALDAFCTYHLNKVFTEKMSKFSRKEVDLNSCYYDIEIPLIPVVAEMEIAGVNLDCRWLKKISGKATVELNKCAEEVYKLAGIRFNIGSSKQLAEVLFDRLKYPVIEMTDKGARGTGKEVLKELAYRGYEVAEAIVEYKALKILITTFMTTLPTQVGVDGKLRGGFNALGTITGRFSSNSPNLQNIPAREKFGIRKAFKASKGCVLVGGDYDQLELKMMGIMADDPTLIKAYSEGIDIHSLTTESVNEKLGLSLIRSQGKQINFSVLYGMAGKSLANKLNSELKQLKKKGKIGESEYKRLFLSDKQGAKIIEGFFATYAVFARKGMNKVNLAKRTGYITTYGNRIRWVPELKNKSTFNQGKRFVINTWIQGSAGDVVKIAMVNIHKRFRLEGVKGSLILQVHDELLADVSRQDAERARIIMQEEAEGVLKNAPIQLTCSFDIYDNWLEMKKGKRERKLGLVESLILGVA